jgi:putative spermidine/putrescine transport system ATP-binding protein
VQTRCYRPGSHWPFGPFARYRQIGTPDEIYARPTSSFVANFIGESNRLAGRVAARRGDLCTVALDGGGSVEALAVRVGDLGSRTTLSIRPEKVRVGPLGDGENRFEAEVLEIIYLGDHRRVRLRVAANEGFVLRLPEELGCRIGQRLAVAWSAGDCRALDHDSSKPETGACAPAGG